MNLFVFYLAFAGLASAWLILIIELFGLLVLSVLFASRFFCSLVHLFIYFIRIFSSGNTAAAILKKLFNNILIYYPVLFILECIVLFVHAVSVGSCMHVIKYLFNNSSNNNKNNNNNNDNTNKNILLLPLKHAVSIKQVAT